LGGEDLDEAAPERVELVSVGDVPVQADREKLRQHVDAIAAAVDAVADGDVDEAILAGDRHSRLAAEHGQRVEPAPTSAAEDETEDFTVHARGSLIRSSLLVKDMSDTDSG